ncbi:MAG: hypothetical protein NC833_02330 [Candidatus Omnitrophica bacterium]|nr:hypothetical protein [Candidatus Omnitrophota bacterium]
MFCFLILNYKFAFSTNIRTIIFYKVSYVEVPPEIDGVLDEDCWQKTDSAVVFYEYWKPEPGPGELRTEFKMLYNKKGVYLGIKNYDEYVDKIKATIKEDDSPNLWTDDCNEIYFDQNAAGIGYLKFTVNFLGAKHNLRQIDTALSDLFWKGQDWFYKTSKGKDYWIVEAFFPWNDLLKVKEPKEELWMFNIVRYSYSTGNFRGVTWSPGGNYMCPDKFGYIYFSSEDKNINQIGSILSKKVTPPWELVFENGFLTCLNKGNFFFIPFEKFLQGEKKKIEDWIEKVNKLIDKVPKNKNLEKYFNQYDSIKKEFTEIDYSSTSKEKIIDQLKKIRLITTQIEEIYWRFKIELL